MLLVAAGIGTWKKRKQPPALNHWSSSSSLCRMQNRRVRVERNIISRLWMYSSSIIMYSRTFVTNCIWVNVLYISVCILAYRDGRRRRRGRWRCLTLLSKDIRIQHIHTSNIGVLWTCQEIMNSQSIGTYRIRFRQHWGLEQHTYIHNS